MKKKKVTMQSIADELGVSKVTVYKALRNKDGVGSDLKNKIEKLASEYGYKAPLTDEHQEMLSQNIVIFCDNKYFDEDDVNCFYLGIYKKISRYLVKQGCTATLCTISKSNNYSNIKEMLDNKQFDGVILLGVLYADFVSMIDKVDIPKVYVDSGSKTLGHDNVIIENFYSTYKITRYLIENGHSNIGFVGSIGVTSSITDRYLGYYKALIENNIPINKEWIVRDRDKENNIIKDMKIPSTLPTAFVCNCDDTAVKFIKTLQDNNIKVPQDVSIVSFDDDVLSRMCTPKLTTLAVDKDKMAKKAVATILYRIKNPNAANNILELIDCRIVYRESVKKLND